MKHKHCTHFTHTLDTRTHLHTHRTHAPLMHSRAHTRDYTVGCAHKSTDKAAVVDTGPCMYAYAHTDSRHTDRQPHKQSAVPRVIARDGQADAPMLGNILSRSRSSGSCSWWCRWTIQTSGTVPSTDVAMPPSTRPATSPGSERCKACSLAAQEIGRAPGVDGVRQ